MSTPFDPSRAPPTVFSRVLVNGLKLPSPSGVLVKLNRLAFITLPPLPHAARGTRDASAVPVRPPANRRRHSRRESPPASILVCSSHGFSIVLPSAKGRFTCHPARQ